MKKIAIIGCGVIGTAIAEFVHKELSYRGRIVGICDIDLEKAKALSKRLKPRPKIFTSIEDLVQRADFIIEAASASISGVVAEKAVSFGKDVLIMSTGGLLDRAYLFERARRRHCNIYIPSGAICGLDGLKSAGIGKIKKVSLTTRKPLQGLKGAPYLKKKGIDIDKIKKEMLIYSGDAKEAIRYFPQNINVAATLSIFGIGPEHTKVSIITSPRYTRNIHEIEVEGEFGRLYTKTENLPSRENPKTSQLAVFSALATLKEAL